MEGQTVKLVVFRYDPKGDKEPSYDSYLVPWREGLTLLQALKYVRDHLDPTLAFRDYCCGCAWCMSCLVAVNGQVRQACMVILTPDESVQVDPVRGYELVRDLVVDFHNRTALRPQREPN